MSSNAPLINVSTTRFQAIMAGTTQKISVASASAATSNAFTAGVSIVRVAVSVDCYIKFGGAPTATTNDIFMPAGTVDYFGILEDGTTKLAAIRASIDGVLTVTEGQ